jgi:Protein of unknown function (DUF2840)
VRNCCSPPESVPPCRSNNRTRAGHAARIAFVLGPQSSINFAHFLQYFVGGLEGIEACWDVIKQLAWLIRDTGGQATLLLSNGLAVGRLTPEVRQDFTKFVTGTTFVWTSLEAMVAGVLLPPSVVDAMAAAKKGYFDPEFLAASERLLNATIAGEKPGGSRWRAEVIERLSAATPGQRYSTVPWVTPGGDILLRLTGWPNVERVLQLIDAVEALDIHPADVALDYWYVTPTTACR